MKILKHLIFSLAGGFVLILLSFNLLFFLNFPYLQYTNFKIDSNILILGIIFFFFYYILVILYIKAYNFIAHENYSIDFFSLSYLFTFLRVGVGYIIMVYLINYYVYYNYIYYGLKGLFFLNLFGFILLTLIFFYERNYFSKDGKNKKAFFLALIILIFSLILLFNIRYFHKSFSHLKLSSSVYGNKKLYYLYSKKRRVINLYVEGLSYDFIFPLISEGKLPNFGWLIENGSWARSKTLDPINKWSAYSSYITGVPPSKNLMYSFWKKSFTSSFSSAPYILPNGFFLKTLERLNFIKRLYSKPSVYYKKDIFSYLENYNVKSFKVFFLKEEKELSVKKSFTNFPSPFDELVLKDSVLVKSFRKNILLDEQRFSLFIQKLSAEKENTLFYSLYIDGLLDTELRFYKYSFPEYYSSVPEEDIHLYGGIIEKYYQYIDRYIGRILLNFKSSDLLIISSSFGVAPLDPFDQIINRLSKKEIFSAKISGSPEGVLILYGNGIKKNYILNNFSFLNVYPIITYYLQLPVPANSSKNFSLEMFEKKFIKENPLVFSYERNVK